VFVERAANTGQVRAREVPGTSEREVQGRQRASDSVLDFARLTVIFADPLLLAQFYDELKQKEQQSEEKSFKILRVKSRISR